MKKCVVTGGAGFIGSHIVDKLIMLGCEVIAVDNLFTGNVANIRQHLKNSKFKFERMSILHNEIKSTFIGADTIFHLAAIPRVQYSIRHPYLTEKVNISGTLNVLECARIVDVDKIVFSSSSSVYGEHSMLPLREDMLPNPISCYGVHKLAGEHYMRAYNKLYGIKTVILRYFNVYGPRDDPSITPPRLIPHTISSISKNLAPEIFGDGTQTRDFTYIDDVVDATMLAAELKHNDLYRGPINIGSGKNTSVSEVVKIIQHVFEKGSITPIFKKRFREPMHTQADIRKAKTILGWHPKTSLFEGIYQTIEWFKQNCSTNIIKDCKQ